MRSVRDHDDVRSLSAGITVLRTLTTLGFLVFIALEDSVVVAGLLFAFVVSLELVLRRPDLVREAVFPLAVIGFVAGVVLSGDATADLEFYVVTAQVVPALFIALAIEIQGYMREHIGEDCRAAVIVALTLAFAEIKAWTPWLRKARMLATSASW